MNSWKKISFGSILNCGQNFRLKRSLNSFCKQRKLRQQSKREKKKKNKKKFKKVTTPTLTCSDKKPGSYDDLMLYVCVFF